ncbi:MAG: PQQ-dependent dehydrogenase, methanol/ethanol family [Gemmatimonadota bacterium]|nr:PQQ-dependent dehydrogenase, methanol/ethanol family [Gemmatimonadota bacterium]
MKPTSFVPPTLSARAMPTLIAVAGMLAAFASTVGSPVAGQQAGTDRGVSEWPMHGRDAAETRYSPLDQINTDNVGGLRLAWRWEIPKTGARLETTPLVVDGMLYATGALSFVFALDAATGEEIWRWDPGIPDAENGGPRACCGDVNRGVAVDGDIVYAALLDGRLVALDRHDGSVRWTTQTTLPGSDYTITGAPRVAGGAVIIGNGGAEYGVRGYVTAYDAETGEQLWRTYTVPGNPALGFESEAMRAAAETWTGEWWIAGGGGTVWDAMVHDESAGLFYIGTGNGSPWNRDHRSPGGGDNLYLSAIVALDAANGSIVWHYQTTPGDDWDYTATQPLMLLDLEIGGRDRRVIVQAPKNGFFYVVDRITGELISAEAFADDLTWASSVDPETGRPIETPEARYGMNGRGVYLAPGPRGAHNWHTMSFNPETGLVYLPATNNNYYYEMTGTYEYERGRWNTGTARGDAGRRPERPALKGPANLLLGWDPAENREVWRVPARGGHGGTMTTAGNLVFWATGSNLAAVDARTGQELWSADVGAGAGSPVTYSIDGRQYVSIAAGRVSTVGAPYIWTFALDTGAGPAEAASTEWTTAAPEDVGLSSEVLARIGPTMQQFLDADRTAGIMTMVARRGEIVHWEAHGWRVLDEDPLEPDDIFRIYSMTKPVTSVAAMMLVEDGLLSLDAELASVIPEFADAAVYDNGATRPPDRPILIRDLLTHTSGLTYGIFGDSPVDSMYNRALYAASMGSRRDLEGRVDVIASLPLVDDPGDRWIYSMSTDVLGRVVEVVSGESLDDFFRGRIFEPLGMNDTGFHVPAGKHDRFTRMYRISRQGLQPAGQPGDDAFTRPATWFSGGGGLTSTATDYLRFARMLLGGGEVNGIRLLQRETVEEMTRNQLPEELVPILPGLGDTGFGLGFAVPADEEDGAYWWSGVANTYFWIDPAEELIAFAWTQLQPFGGAPVDRLLRPIVYEAILEGN